MPRFGIPTSPKSASSPRNRPKPIATNTTVPIQKSIRFFMMMLPAFLALAKPHSTIANPACIQKTNAAPIRNQTPKTFSSIKLLIKLVSINSPPSTIATRYCYYVSMLFDYHF